MRVDQYITIAPWRYIGRARNNNPAIFSGARVRCLEVYLAAENGACDGLLAGFGAQLALGIGHIEINGRGADRQLIGNFRNSVSCAQPE